MKKVFIKIHRILGSVLSLVFLMWFLSGFMMIFSGFPHPNRTKAFEKSEPLNNYRSLILLPKDSIQSLNQLTLEVVNNTAFYSVRGRAFYSSNAKMINANSLKPFKTFPVATLDSMVKARYQSNIVEKEVLTDYDAWIPWASFKYFFPIHKYYLNDSAQTQVYLASTTGKVVQETTSKTRWFARFGAIPHWFYFKSLRLKSGLWADFIIYLSGLGATMCLTGLIVGIIRSRKWKTLKKKGILKFSPYKEKWFRWHHIFGMVFGLFVFTFVFSGMMSMMDVPQWILPMDYNINYNKLWAEKLSNTSEFKLPLSKVLEDERFDNVKQIDFKQIDSIPYYVLYQTYWNPVFINANNADSVLQKTFSYDDIKQIAMKKFEGKAYDIKQLKVSDNYYNPEGETIAKLSFDDANSTWVYINAENPTNIRTMNKSRRVSRWLYKGLHSFRFPKIEEIEWLRITLLIIVSVFGTIISLSGVVLSWRYFNEWAKRRGEKNEINYKK